MADTDEPDHRLRKDLTWRDLIVFGVSVVIRAGIFTITVSTAAESGSRDLPVVHHGRHHVRTGGALLCRVRLDSSRRGVRIHLRLCDIR